MTSQAPARHVRARLPHRSALALFLIVTVGPGVAQGAAAKAKPKPKPPSCNLVMDPKGDVVAAAAPLSPDPSLDIVSADVATNATTLTVVIRVASLATGTSDTASPFGRSWHFGFAAGAETVLISIADGPLGPEAITPYPGGKITLDVAHSEIRYSVPLSALDPGPGPEIQARTVAVTNFHLSSDEGVEAPTIPGPPYVPYAQADSAASMKTYPPGNASCVAVGS